jgi:outer membrane efflux protein
MSNRACVASGRVKRASTIVFAFLATTLASSGLVAQTKALGSQSILPDYTRGPGWFPGVIKPYRETPVPPLVVENSPRVHDLIHGGKLELSLSDALSLALENNLDIAVQRYLHPVAQTDVLRTLSGQAARGIPGALLPSGLSQGALGVGVNQFQGAGGVGSAGGISGGGGAVQVPQAGSFDPSVSFNSSWDRTTAPLNTIQVAGVPQVSTVSTAFSGSYTQTVVQVEDGYWNLAAAGEGVTAAQRVLDAAQTLLENTKAMVAIGSGAALDVTTAQSSVAVAERDLIVAKTNVQLQQVQLKNLLSKRADPELDAAEIETTDQLPEPNDADMPDLD